MKTKPSLFNPLALAAMALIGVAVNLPAQSPPTITTQPASQTNLPGSTVTFNVAVTGTGPFTYQWLCNGVANSITTVAGNGSAADGGDGDAAPSTSLDPTGVAVDAHGNLYIADYQNNVIRMVNTNGIITTMAGNGSAAYAGDGGAATNASLNNPTGVALDVFGNVYISDFFNCRIREVTTNGIITTVAGNGNAIYAGDGGAATNASLRYPKAVALDAYGNLYIADFSNHRIREVTTNGIITTMAGNGTATYAGDGGAATNASVQYPSGVAFDGFGNLYIGDQNNQRIRMVNPDGIITTVAGNGSEGYSGDGGAATNASLNYPAGVTLDAAGNLYFADEYNNRIRMVGANGTITTMAGNGIGTYAGDDGTATNASLCYPQSMTFDAFGNLYIADVGNKRIREVYASTYPTFGLNLVSTANAGNYSVIVTSSYGSVTSAVATLTVPAPAGITVQPTNQIAALGSSPSLLVLVVGSGPFGYLWYFAGTNLVQSGTNNLLTLTNVSANGAGDYQVIITNNYGSVTSQVAALTLLMPPTVATQPISQAALAGTTASFNVTVGSFSPGPFTYQWRFNGTNLPAGIITTVAGKNSGYSGDGGAATNASLNAPFGVVLDAAGDLYIADANNYRIRRVNPNGIITTVAGNGIAGYAGDDGVATNAKLRLPQGVALDGNGNLYFADTDNNRIRRVNTNGIITTVAGGGNSGPGYSGAATNASLDNPVGVAFDTFGNLYIGDSQYGLVRMVSTNGIISTVAGGGPIAEWNDIPAADAVLADPTGVALDGSGNLYIAVSADERICRMNPEGILFTMAGNGKSLYAGDDGVATNATLWLPSDAVLDGSGNLYIADTDDNRIRLVATNGIITTLAGKNTSGYSGDGGAATNASLYHPTGVALDTLGNLYIADQANNRVRKLWLNAASPTLTLSQITTNNAGNYSVVITSPYGSVTSAVVSLTVTLPPPQIFTGGAGFGFLTNQFGFNLSGASGQTIIVDGSTNLVNWTPLFTNLANGTPFYFFDPAWTNFPWRFYRARQP